MLQEGRSRFAAREQFDKSAENDPEYAKVVREVSVRMQTVDSFRLGLDAGSLILSLQIQEGHSRSGWLVGSGAFDRDDLNYIRDFKEVERQKEQVGFKRTEQQLSL